MAQLDETISSQQTGHLTDHQTLAKKANYVFDVHDYGATGDGSTDDSAAFIAAVAAAATQGPSTLYVPPGTYMLGTLDSTTDGINLGSNNDITIRGEGPGISIIKMGVASWRSIIRGDQSDYITITGLTLDGNKSSYAGSPGIGLRFLSSAANNIVIDNVEITNTDNAAISSTASYVWIDRCDIHDCDGGVRFNPASSHIWLTRNDIKDIGTEWSLIQDAVYFGGQFLYAAGNTIARATDTGINIGGTTEPTGWARVTDNVIYQIGNSGINTGGGSNQVITNNIIYACGRKDGTPRSNAGIRIRDDGGGTFTSVGVTVTGNRCYENTADYALDAGALGQLDGIEIKDQSSGGTPNNVVIVGNNLLGNTTNGISLVDAPATSAIANNLGYP